MVAFLKFCVILFKFIFKIILSVAFYLEAMYIWILILSAQHRTVKNLTTSYWKEFEAHLPNGRYMADNLMAKKSRIEIDYSSWKAAQI